MRLWSFLFLAAIAWAQPPSCVPTSVPPLVRYEGYTERISDITYRCLGPASSSLTANLTIAVNTEVTNRLGAGNTLLGINVTADSIALQNTPTVVNSNTVSYNGLTIPFGSNGQVTLRFSGIRVNASRFAPGSQITASLALNAAGLPFSTSQLSVAVAQKSLFGGFSGSLVCAQGGSPFPGEPTFNNFLLAKSAFASARFTEGFADAFSHLGSFAGLNADAGQRIIVRYSGFPSDAHLWVPTVVAGSSAVRPTGGGDFGVPAWGGTYAASAEGSLLLALVAGADATGAGGTVSFLPSTLGSQQVTFDGMTELPFVSGNTYAVYEVVDSNPARVETAQFPAFLGLLPDGFRTTRFTEGRLYLAAQQNITTASATGAIPRFAQRDPEHDCTVIGDCVTYLPQLTVDVATVDFSATTDSGVQQGGIFIQNTGGGAMRWSAQVIYSGTARNWITLQPAEGINNTFMRMFAFPAGLAAGVHQATLTINGGPGTVAKNILVRFTISTPALPTPNIDAIVSAASFQPVDVVPGSISTIQGTAFDGPNPAVRFNGALATILFRNDRQINVLVPAELSPSGFAQVTVTVDGRSSGAKTVQLAPFAPAIFPRAVLNQDGTQNSLSNPAGPNTIVVVYATGLSGQGVLTGRIGGIDINSPYYAGPAPGIPGVQQFNMVIPQEFIHTSVDLAVCGAAPVRVCSPTAMLAIQ